MVHLPLVFSDLTQNEARDQDEVDLYTIPSGSLSVKSYLIKK